MGFHDTWSGHCVWCIGNSKAKSSPNRIPVENLTSTLACGKVAFSAPDYFHASWKWHLRNGANNWFGLPRRQYPTVGLTICWWHFTVCWTNFELHFTVCWTFVSDFFTLWWLRWSVLALVIANCTNLNFENLMCIAVNFYVESSGHQEALTGLNRATPFWTSGTNVLWNKCSWTVSSFGQTGACLILENFCSMSRSWMTAGGWNEHWHGMLEVAGADDPLMYGMPPWQNFASGRKLETWPSIKTLGWHFDKVFFRVLHNDNCRLHAKFPRGSPLRHFMYSSAEPTLVCRVVSPRVFCRTVVSDSDGRKWKWRLQPRTKLPGCSTCRILSHWFVIYLLSLTPSALNGLPHQGIHEQSQKGTVWYKQRFCRGRCPAEERPYINNEQRRGVVRWGEVKWSEVKWIDMKWSEVKWSEVKWSEVRWDEVTWTEVRSGEVRWNEVKCSGVRRGEVRWGEVRWGEVRWGEVKWSEVKWSEVKWSEVKWSEVNDVTWRDVTWGEVRWGEVRWGEVKWSEVKWSEMKWSELTWHEVRWGEVKWSEVKWGEMKWGELKWGEVRWSEMKWSGVKWSEVKWSEVNWSEVKWSEMRWSEVKWSELKWNEVKWGEVRWSEVKWGEVNWSQKRWGEIKWSEVKGRPTAWCPLHVHVKMHTFEIVVLFAHSTA